MPEVPEQAIVTPPGITTEAITDPHSEGADHYRFRTPYAPALFDQLNSCLPLSPRARLLDLCCGRGELTRSLADRAGHVTAIDGARGMIAAAPPHPRVSYHCHDVNKLAVLPGVAGFHYDHMFLGRAIPYVDTGALGFAAGHCLKSGGAIVVCGAGFDPREPWVAVFNRIRGSYAQIRGDFTGAAKLAALGFFESRRVVVRQSARCDPKFLVAHALSYSLTRQRIAADMAHFTARLHQGVSAYIQGGQLRADVISWALIYRRQPGPGPNDKAGHLEPRPTPLPL